MAKMGKFDISELKKLQKKLNKIKQADMDAFVEACAKELSARLLRNVIKRTPVGQYEKGSGKVGGTLRRGWTTPAAGSGSEGLKTKDAVQYVDTLKIHHYGDVYVIEIINPIEYASYVEFGHRTVNHEGWVPGHFMLTISEQEIRAAAPAILEKKIEEFLVRCME